MFNKVISVLRETSEKIYRPSGPERYERKFVVSHFDARQLECLIRNHPLSFREIFSKRKINNIYLDTFDLKTYFDNVYGNTNRVKVRIRWYGDTFGNIEHPVLELKIKSGLAGNKNSFPLSSFKLDRTFTRDTLFQMFNDSDLPIWVHEKLANYKPVLLNCYSRKYFSSADKLVRITLDNTMMYFSISSRNNNFIKKHVDWQNVIVEMKYSLDAADIASEVGQHLPIRMTKSSKYVNGIELFNPHLST